MYRYSTVDSTHSTGSGGPRPAATRRCTRGAKVCRGWVLALAGALSVGFSALPALAESARGSGAAAGPKPQACFLSHQSIGQALGTALQPGKEEGDSGALGSACTYRGKDYTVWVVLVRPAQFGMTTPQLLRLTEPGTFHPLAGDPDGLQFHRTREGVAPFPSVVYERRGTLVKLRIVGTVPEPVDALNAQLARLPRLP